MIIDQTEWFAYTNNWGLIEPEPGTISDNSQRFSAEALFAGYQNLQIIIAGIYRSQVTPGLFHRNPINGTQNSPDNYYALAAIGGCFYPPLARELYEYGKKNKYVFNNISPGKFTFSAWMGRQVALVSHMKLAAGHKLNWFDELAWCIGLKLSARSDDQDGKVLAWFMVKVARYQHKIVSDNMRREMERWSKALSDYNRDGIGGVLGLYYHPQHFSHPNSKYLMGEIGQGV